MNQYISNQQTSLKEMTDAEIKEKAILLKDMFYGLKQSRIIQIAKAVNVMARTGLISPRVGLERSLLLACYGDRLNFSIQDSLNNLYVVDNKISLHSYGPLIVCQRSGLLEKFEVNSYKDDNGYTVCTCTVKRKGIKGDYTATFGIEDAKRAGLLNRKSWKEYPMDHLMHKAKKRALWARFSDILSGLSFLDEEDNKLAQSHDQEDTEGVEEMSEQSIEADKELDTLIKTAQVEVK